jgi:hypothetical protein
MVKFIYILESVMSTIINLFGGPGIGKSTISAGLFSEMKKNNYDVELTYEFPKMVAWEENYSSIKDQFFITANQHRNISRLYNKVSYIIVDSPIILGIIYKCKYNNIDAYPSNLYGDLFDEFIFDLFKKYDNLNIVLERKNGSFDENGRLQNYDESRKIDLEIEKVLSANDIPYIKFPVYNDTHLDIYKHIKENKKLYDK